MDIVFRNSDTGIRTVYSQTDAKRDSQYLAKLLRAKIDMYHVVINTNGHTQLETYLRHKDGSVSIHHTAI